MDALVFHGLKNISIAQKPFPEISADTDVLLQVAYCGICGTDLGIYSCHHPAKPGVTMGHEYAGTVVDAGNAVAHLKKGDKVAVDPNLKCGFCYYCQNGQSSQCEWMAKGNTLGIFADGGLAPFNVAPVSAIYKLPNDMSLKDAALVEPLSCVLNAISAADIQPGDSVLIIGAGPIGSLFADLLSQMASCVFVSEIDEFRRKHTQTYTPHVVNPKTEDLPARVKQLTNGLGCDAVFEATGYALEDALACVKKRGKVILFGMNQDVRTTIQPYVITRNEIQIIGSYIQDSTFQPAIETLYRGKVRINHFVTHTFPLPKAEEAFAVMGLNVKTGERTQPEGIKVLIKVMEHVSKNF